MPTKNPSFTVILQVEPFGLREPHLEKGIWNVENFILETAVRRGGRTNLFHEIKSREAVPTYITSLIILLLLPGFHSPFRSSLGSRLNHHFI